MSRNAQLLEHTQRLLAEQQTLHHLLGQQDIQVRRAIAEMLHGRTQARLQAAWLYASKARRAVRTDPEQAEQWLDSIQHLIDRVQEEDIREASHHLHPSALAVGLGPALESLVEPLHDCLGVHLHVDPTLDAVEEPDGQRLGDEIRLGLYRIAEEALSNVYRHANARNVSVIVRRLPGSPPGTPYLLAGAPVAAAADDHGLAATAWVELVIWDDGIGTTVDSSSHGLGLRLIAARVADLGGVWNLESPAEGGTRLRVIVPARGR